MKAVLPFIIFLFIAKTVFAQAEAYEYGRHIIMPCALINNAGPGYGIQGEWMLGNREKISIVLPVALCYGNFNHSRTDERSYPLMVVAAPGFRFYPTTSCGTVRYSLGVSLLLGTGKGTF